MIAGSIRLTEDQKEFVRTLNPPTAVAFPLCRVEPGQDAPDRLENADAIMFVTMDRQRWDILKSLLPEIRDEDESGDPLPPSHVFVPQADMDRIINHLRTARRIMGIMEIPEESEHEVRRMSAITHMQSAGEILSRHI